MTKQAVLSLKTNSSSRNLDVDFDCFIVDLKHLRKAYNNFDKKLWLDYADILAVCHVNHLEHYITLLFKKTLYTQYLASELLKSDLFGTLSDDKIQKKQLDESKLFLTDVIHEMKRKFTQLDAIMFKRTDICARRSEYDMNIPRILISLKLKERYRVVLDTNRADCTLKFKVDLTMASDVDNLIIGIPTTAPVDYSHDVWLKTRKQEEEEALLFNETDACASDIADEFDNQNESIQRLNANAGVGKRTTVQSKSRRADYLVPGSVAQFNSPDCNFVAAQLAHTGFAKISFESSTSDGSPPVSAESADSFNTTFESSICSSNFDALSPIPSSMTFLMTNSAHDVSLARESDCSANPSPRNNSHQCSSSLSLTVEQSPLFDDTNQASFRLASESPLDEENAADSSVVTTPKLQTADDLSHENAIKMPMRCFKSKLSLTTSSDEEGKINIKPHSKYQSAIIRQTEISSDDDEEVPITRKRLSNSSKTPNSPTSSFFCNDGEYEEIHPLSAFKKEIKSHNDHKIQTLSKSFSKTDDDDAEYRSSSDEDLSRFKARRKEQLSPLKGFTPTYPAIKSKSKSVNLLKAQSIPFELKPLKERKNKKTLSVSASSTTSEVKLSNSSKLVLKQLPDSVDNDEKLTFAQVLKDSTLKKRNRDEFKDNPCEDAALFLSNTTRQFSRFESGNAQEITVADIAPEELRAINKKMDADLILFLVKHCTTRIGAEIGLERCVMDYIFKKQEFNRLRKTEQQYISNWQEIFLSIEKLVIGTIKHERNFDHDVLERAHQRTKNLLHQNFIKLRHFLESDESLPEEDIFAKVEELKAKHGKSAAKLMSIAGNTKLFNEQSYRYSLRKVNSTLHSVCLKVCMMWLEQNNALHLLDSSMLATYSKRLQADSATLEQMSSVTKNGFFVMGADDMLELVDGAITLPSSEELETEQRDLQKILNGDHVNKLLSTIESINDDAENVLRLINVVWSKEPRIKLSYSISKPKKASETDDLKNIITPTVASVGPLTLTPGNLSVMSEDPSNSLAVAAVGSHKITSFYASDGKDAQQSGAIEAPIALGGTHTSKVVDVDFNTSGISALPLTDGNSKVSKIAMSFDQILISSASLVIATSDTMCLQLTIKSNRSHSLLERLKLLRFIMAINSNEEDFLKYMSLFEKKRTWYDMFECVWLLKCNNVNSCNTASDGYCMTRGLYQLKSNEERDFQLTINEMRDIDNLCNTSKPNNTNAAFGAFVGDLPNMLKDESGSNQTLVHIIGDLKWFTFKAKLRMMELLLRMRAPGHALEEKFWGDAQTVSMLGFNVTCVSALVGEDFMDIVPLQRNKWVKLETSSVPCARSLDSWKQSNTTMSDLDAIADQKLNLLLYKKPHFSVCSQSSSQEQIKSNLTTLKIQCMKKIVERVLLSLEITPDLLKQLDNVILKCESRSQTIEFDYFDSAQFAHLLKRRFPDSVKKTPMTIDFSEDTNYGADDNKEVFELKRAVDLSNSKLKVMEDYNTVIYHECLKAKRTHD